jgi:hypothetical protein
VTKKDERKKSKENKGRKRTNERSGVRTEGAAVQKTRARLRNTLRKNKKTRLANGVSRPPREANLAKRIVRSGIGLT